MKFTGILNRKPNKVREKMLYPKRSLTSKEKKLLIKKTSDSLHRYARGKDIPFPAEDQKPVRRYKLRRELICFGGFVAEVWL